MDGKYLTRYFYNLGLKKIDYLLPDQNHDFGSSTYPKPDDDTRYAKVFIDAYDEWIRIDDPTFIVRKFELLILALMGLPIGLDSIGEGPIKVFTFETNGEIEPVDTMKICGNNFTKGGFNINDNPFIDIDDIPLIKLGITKNEISTDECRSCNYLQMCGGGYLPHRFQNGHFTKTVYCADMIKICSHIEAAVMKTIDKATAV